MESSWQDLLIDTVFDRFIFTGSQIKAFFLLYQKQVRDKLKQSLIFTVM